MFKHYTVITTTASQVTLKLPQMQTTYYDHVMKKNEI